MLASRVVSAGGFPLTPFDPARRCQNHAFPQGKMLGERPGVPGRSPLILVLCLSAPKYGVLFWFRTRPLAVLGTVPIHILMWTRDLWGAG